MDLHAATNSDMCFFRESFKTGFLDLIKWGITTKISFLRRVEMSSCELHFKTHLVFCYFFPNFFRKKNLWLFSMCKFCSSHKNDIAKTCNILSFVENPCKQLLIDNIFSFFVFLILKCINQSYFLCSLVVKFFWNRKCQLCVVTNEQTLLYN